MRKLSFAQLDMVAGGGRVEANAYLDELCRKYGVTDRHEVLGRATREEVQHYCVLYLDYKE